MKRGAVSVYLMSAGLTVVLLLGAYTVYADHQNDQDLAADRVERVKQINRVNFDLCQKIQQLYATRRQEARENYRNLARDARLLGIKLTPELRAASKAARDRTLERFQDSKCPREVISGAMDLD